MRAHHRRLPTAGTDPRRRQARLGALPGVTSVDVRTGTMDAKEKGALMEQGASKAQEDSGVTVDFPRPPESWLWPPARGASASPL